MSTSVPALRFEHLSKTYPKGAAALRDVSFTVEEGEFFGLLGPNGAGKTTLISCLVGLTRPDAGRITVCGIDASRERREASRRLGIVPQEITFDPFLTVRETLRYQSGYWGVRGNDRWIDEVLGRLALEDKADSRVRALSGGMKRRVLVAQALVHRPAVIVLDEPTAGVDIELREHLWNFVGELHRRGTTVVLTTHYLEEAQALCGRIAILQKGEIAALERTDRLLARFESSVLRCRIVRGTLPERLLPRLLRGHGDEVSLRVEGAADVADVLEAFRSADVGVESLTVREANLEDVFLSLTRKEVR